MRPLSARTLVAFTIVLFGCVNVPPNTDPFDAVRDLSEQLPVFPGAQGFGTDTVAGRGGEIVRVTSRAASGRGTLREALEDTAGPRVVVFEVGGVIDLERPITITEPYLTVAGQTAPDPGITLIGAGIRVMTHDVLIQHIAVRPGDRPEGPDPEDRDGISVVGDARGATQVSNVVIDHCSVSWAIDEGTSTWYAGVSDVTFSNCIIAENLSRSLHREGEHSKGLLIGDHSRRVAIIGNLFAHNMRRNPFIKGDTSTVVSGNLVYNPGTAVLHFGDRERSGPARSTVTNNVLLRGVDSAESLRFIAFGRLVSTETQVYQESNLEMAADGTTRYLVLPSEFRPVMVAEPPVRIAPLHGPDVQDVYDSVLTNAGSRPWSRNDVDARILASVRDRTGTIIDSQEEVGGFPRYEPVVRSLVLPPRPDDDDDGDGYTNLEEWLWDR